MDNSRMEIDVIESRYRQSRVVGWIMVGVGCAVIATALILALVAGKQVLSMVLLGLLGLFCAAFGGFILHMAAVLHKSMAEYKELLNAEEEQLANLDDDRRKD